MLGIAQVAPRRSFEGGADQLVSASDFDRAGDGETQHPDRVPGPGQLIIPPRGGNRRKLFEMDRVMSGAARRPGFLGSEDQDRREPNRNRAEDVLDRLQRAASSDTGGRIA